MTAPTAPPWAIPYSRAVVLNWAFLFCHCLTMSTDIFGCHYWVKCYWHLIKAKVTAEWLIIIMTTPLTNRYLASDVQSSEFEKCS